MSGIDIGTICIKTKGRELGEKAVIVDFGKDANTVLIDGIKVRRRNCNLKHLFPTKEKINIKKNASHEEVVKLLK